MIWMMCEVIDKERLALAANTLNENIATRSVHIFAAENIEKAPLNVSDRKSFVFAESGTCLMSQVSHTGISSTFIERY